MNLHWLSFGGPFDALNGIVMCDLWVLRSTHTTRVLPFDTGKWVAFGFGLIVPTSVMTTSVRPDAFLSLSRCSNSFSTHRHSLTSCKLGKQWMVS